MYESSINPKRHGEVMDVKKLSLKILLADDHGCVLYEQFWKHFHIHLFIPYTPYWKIYPEIYPDSCVTCVKDLSWLQPHTMCSILELCIPS